MTYKTPQNAKTCGSVLEGLSLSPPSAHDHGGAVTSRGRRSES